jgi:hypothetical protein
VLLAAMVAWTHFFYAGATQVTDFWFKIGGGLIVFLPIAAIAYWNDMPRIFLYAAVIGGGISILLITGSTITFLVGGLVITALGLVIFIRFLRSNPLPEKDPADE